jgi:hypothetical protein
MLAEACCYTDCCMQWVRRSSTGRGYASEALGTFKLYKDMMGITYQRQVAHQVKAAETATA